MSKSANSGGNKAAAVNTKICVMTVLARYLSSRDHLAPAAGRRVNMSAENPANVIISPANVYKRIAPLTSKFSSPREPSDRNQVDRLRRKIPCAQVAKVQATAATVLNGSRTGPTE